MKNELQLILHELRQPARDIRDMTSRVELCQRAIALLPEKGQERLWAALEVELGMALRQSPLGNQADNIERAIDHYKRALQVFTQETFPVDWGMTQNNLGNAYSERIIGSRSENLEQAIYHHQQALLVRTRQRYPDDWAMSQNNLGNTYSQRIAGNQAENFEQAIYHYQQALQVRTRQGSPERWAATQHNLANTYRKRIAGNQAENIEQAIYHYQQALQVRTRHSFAADWALSVYSLGNAYINRVVGGRAENVEQAIYHYQQALQVHSRQDFPAEWAKTHNNLGEAYRNRIEGNHEENVTQAVYHYQQAQQVYTRQTFPVEHRGTLRNLILLYFGEKRWSDAYRLSIEAITVSVDIFAVAFSDAGRINAIEESSDLYVYAAYSAVQMGNYRDAFEHLEAGKLRLLAEAQSLRDANLGSLDKGERASLQTLSDQIKKLEYEHRLPQGHPARRDDRVVSDDLRDVRMALRALINKLQAKYHNFIPEALPVEGLLSLIPAEGALVALLFTSQGSVIFILPSGTRVITADHTMLLENFTLSDLHAITRQSDDTVGWLRYYIDYRFIDMKQSNLREGINDVTNRLWKAFVGRIHERLQSLEVKRVLLMPQGDTNIVPLHAAWREVDGAQRYFMDDYVITYAPSLTALITSQHKGAKQNNAFVVGVSKYQQKNDLPNARVEAESVAAALGATALLDEVASVEVVRDRVSGKAFVHLSCHGGFGWEDNAYAAALYLGNDEMLPLSQIMAQFDLDEAWLVVLSACETGIVDINSVPDEFVGLPMGFMHAGAAAVISSLWTVEDRSTALLMERMYKLMLDKENPLEPAQALREAQFWLRNATTKEIGDYYQAFLIPRMSQPEAANAFVEILQRAKPGEKPYAHPFYWAAFTYNGL